MRVHVFPVVVATVRCGLTLHADPQLRRKYKTDFELYDQRAVDPENSKVEIHVGIK